MNYTNYSYLILLFFIYNWLRLTLWKEGEVMKKNDEE